jgi:hypothetical protein
MVLQVMTLCSLLIFQMNLLPILEQREASCSFTVLVLTRSNSFCYCMMSLLTICIHKVGIINLYCSVCWRFYLREKLNDSLWTDSFTMDPQLIRDYFYRFLYQHKDREYPDLCQLPDLNEQVLLDNLRARFIAGHIYTYVGSILIAVNPFKVSTCLSVQ